MRVHKGKKEKVVFDDVAVKHGSTIGLEPLGAEKTTEFDSAVVKNQDDSVLSSGESSSSKGAILTPQCDHSDQTVQTDTFCPTKSTFNQPSAHGAYSSQAAPPPFV